MIPCVIRQNSQIASRTTFAVPFSEMWTFTCLLETYILAIHNCFSVLKVGCNLLPQPLHLSCFIYVLEIRWRIAQHVHIYLSGVWLV